MKNPVAIGLLILVLLVAIVLASDAQLRADFGKDLRDISASIGHWLRALVSLSGAARSQAMAEANHEGNTAVGNFVSHLGDLGARFIQYIVGGANALWYAIGGGS